MKRTKRNTLKRILILTLIVLLIPASVLGFAFADTTGDPPEPPSGNPGEEPPEGFGGGPGGAPPDGSGGPGGAPPDGSGGPGGPGGMSAADITYTGVTEFTGDTTEEG